MPPAVTSRRAFACFRAPARVAAVNNRSGPRLLLQHSAPVSSRDHCCGRCEFPKLDDAAARVVRGAAGPPAGLHFGPGFRVNGALALHGIWLFLFACVLGTITVRMHGNVATAVWMHAGKNVVEQISAFFVAFNAVR